MTRAELQKVAESIKTITRFPLGYPKRIQVSPMQKNSQAWQRYFDNQYNLCMDHAQQGTLTLFNASHTS